MNIEIEQASDELAQKDEVIAEQKRIIEELQKQLAQQKAE